MATTHPFGAEFIAMINNAQQAYTERRLADYLAAYSPDYCGVMLNSEIHEDGAGLEARMQADVDRFDLLLMDFTILGHWFSGEVGYAHMKYFTRLRRKDNGKVLIDERENLIVAQHSAGGRWEIMAKIGIKAKNYTEE